jgi:hypothetical protein
VTCSWSQFAGLNSFHAITPPQEQEVPRRTGLESSPQIHATIPDIQYSLKTTPILPEPHLLRHLFQIFFDRHHDAEFCSFFHIASLDIPTLYNRSPLLVTSVISLSALYISAHEAEADFGFETPLKLSDHYAGVAKSYAHEVCDEPSSECCLSPCRLAELMLLKVYTIQAYLILAIRELLTWSNTKAYMYAGTALRMSQAIYLSVEVGQRYSARQKETRRRTFWACFVVDRLVSYSCNKPFTIPYQSARLQLPCPDNVFAFDEAYNGFTVENLGPQASRLSQLGIRPFFIAMMRLWGDMALLHVSGGRRRSKYGPRASESEFYRCERAIEDFSSSLPPSLNWSSQNYKLHHATGQTQAYVNLNFILHHSRCVMHQEYLPQLDSQYSLDSETYSGTVYDTAGISLDYIDRDIIKICMNSINVITEMALTLNAGSAKDRILLQSVFAANAILTASAVHLWVLYTQTCDACPKHEALAKAEKLRQIIKSWQPQWGVATAWVETLEMLYNLYVYSYGKVVDSDLDCWDMEDDINSSSEVAGEVTDESGAHQTIYDEHGIPDPSMESHRLYDKIRSILVNPMLDTDIKKRNLRIYCRTLWQHVWTDDFGEDFFNFESIMGEPASELFNILPPDTVSVNI